MYNYSIVHVPGHIHAAPDATSRCPSSQPEDNDTDEDIVPSVAAYMQHQKPKAIGWDEIKITAATDEECVTLLQHIQNGFPPSREALPDIIKRYWPMREELYAIQGVPFKDHKMLIPSTLRPQILEALHEGNQGINAILANARQRFFWPGLDSQLRLLKRQCSRCNEIAPSKAREPPSEPPNQEFPFEQVVTDFISILGNDYLIYALDGWRWR